MPQRVAITGSTGLIGSALSAFLRERGDDVVRLVRRAARAPGRGALGPRCPAARPAGACRGRPPWSTWPAPGVGDHRWTPSYQQQILGSRVDGTTTIATALAQLGEPVRLVSGSAVGVLRRPR